MDIKLIGLIGGALACGAVAEAAVIKVPQHYTTIQAAVNAASEGDTVQVGAGTYAEHILISGKAIKLAGAGAGQTTIDATQAGRPVTISTTGTGQVIVSGFTLKNGLVNWDNHAMLGAGQGGGVYAEYANVTLRNNVITNNLGCLGTSIGTLEVTMTMTRNRIENNQGNHDCGQQSVIIRGNRGAESTVSGNVIQNHNVTGLMLQGAGNIVVSNNILRNNVADWDNFGLEHGGLLSLYTELTLTNNLFAGNYGYGVGGAFIYQPETDVPVRISGNSFAGNTAGEGPSSLLLLDYRTTPIMIVKNNQFDAPADGTPLSCTFNILVDESNIFASNPNAAAEGGCATAD
jgi:parallel beta-helix repeat protein